MQHLTCTQNSNETSKLLVPAIHMLLIKIVKDRLETNFAEYDAPSVL